MTIFLTKAAYERYMGLSRIEGMDADKLRALLQEACDQGEGGMLQWMGRPALYLNHAYWACVESSGAGEAITLVDCYGMIQAIAG